MINVYDELYGVGCIIGRLKSDIARIDGRLDGFADGVAMRLDEIDARLERIERKLNHKGERTMDERMGGDE